MGIKFAGFRHLGLSFVFLNLFGLSRCQWHPFSVSSSCFSDSNEGAHSLSFSMLEMWGPKSGNVICGGTVSFFQISSEPRSGASQEVELAMDGVLRKMITLLCKTTASLRMATYRNLKVISSLSLFTNLFLERFERTRS